MSPVRAGQVKNSSIAAENNREADKIIEYRIAQKEHLNGILTLYRQLVPDDEPLSKKQADKIWDRIEKQEIKYFIAAEGGRIVSSLYLVIIPNLTRGGKSIGIIENVITDTEYRRKGIGKKLIETALAYAKENNCYKILLQSNNKRKEAHKFYTRCGFNGDSKRAFEYRYDL